MLSIMRQPVIFVFLILFGGGCQSDREESSSKKVLNGSFNLIFGEPKSSEHRAALQLIKPEIKRVVDALNKRLSLPMDVPIVFTSEHIEEGPAYSGSYMTGLSAEGLKGRQVVYPYEMIQLTENVFTGTGLSSKAFEKAVIATTVFVLVHEVSHALIDILELPVLGREEDAADSGATIFLTSLENGAETIHDAITFWRRFGERRGLHSDAFADTHGLDLQRAYNLACWTYGRDIIHNVIVEHDLPKSRQRSCPMEYSRLASSWDKVLKEYLRD